MQRRIVMAAAVAVVLLAGTGGAVALVRRAGSAGPAAASPGWRSAAGVLPPELTESLAVVVGPETLLFGGTGASAGRPGVTPAQTAVVGGVAIDPARLNMRPLAAPPFDRALEQVAAAVVGRSVVVVGQPCRSAADTDAGCDPVAAEAARYDVSSDSWHALAAPPTGSLPLTSLGADGRAALFGVSDTGETYTVDAATGRWTHRTPALRASGVTMCRSGDTALALTTQFQNDGRITDEPPAGTPVGPGETRLTGQVLRLNPTVYRLGPGTGWSQLTVAPVPPTDVGYDVACGATSAYLFEMHSGQPIGTLRQYLFASGTWRTLPTTTYDDSSWRGRVVTGDNLVLLNAGGPSVVWDSARARWRNLAAPPPAVDLRDARRVLAGDGSVLVWPVPPRGSLSAPLSARSTRPRAERMRRARGFVLAMLLAAFTAVFGRRAGRGPARCRSTARTVHTATPSYCAIPPLQYSGAHTRIRSARRRTFTYPATTNVNKKYYYIFGFKPFVVARLDARATNALQSDHKLYNDFYSFGSVLRSGQSGY